MLRVVAGIIFITVFLAAFRFLPSYLVSGMNANILIILFVFTFIGIMAGGRWR